MILDCEKKCEHKFQDAEYGRHKRVHNTLADKLNPKARCTVCENVRSFGKQMDKKK